MKYYQIHKPLFAFVLMSSPPQNIKIEFPTGIPYKLTINNECLVFNIYTTGNEALTFTGKLCKC
jgi:hypothetical protein